MRRILAAMIFLIAGAVGAAHAIMASGDQETFDARLARSRAEQLAGRRFEVKLGNGRDTYRLGEAIPMRLEFGDAQWFREPTRPDNVDWDWVVAESLDGAAFSDAMEGALEVAAAPGTYCGNIDIATGPHVIDTFLNEWIRFRTPGRYRFFVRSFRAGWVGPEVVSNVVNLRILPAEDGRWEKLMWQWDNGSRAEAARGIRYLGSRQATEFMAHHLDEGAGFMGGLANAPPLETLRALTGVSQTRGVRGFQTIRMLAPVALPYGPHQDRKPGWRRDVRNWIGNVYRAGAFRLTDWLEP